MCLNTPTQHNRGKAGDFAPVVIMPGDPMRAKYIADNFLQEPRLVNDLRCAYAYTGRFQGQRVSVMAHGMGAPSMAIYAHELFSFYDVEAIIRIGTAGSLDTAMGLGALVLAQGACYNSRYCDQFELPGIYAPIGDFGLLTALLQQAKAHNKSCRVGNVFSSDVYYQSCAKGDLDWAKMDVLAIEMETAALYIEAARCHKRAAAMLTITGELATGVYMETERSQSTYDDMIQVALESIGHVG